MASCFETPGIILVSILFVSYLGNEERFLFVIGRVLKLLRILLGTAVEGSSSGELQRKSGDLLLMDPTNFPTFPD